MKARRLVFELVFCTLIACCIWGSISQALATNFLLMFVCLYAFTVVVFVYENARDVYFTEPDTQRVN
jgi:FtsH-binding integral membrane protein